MLQTAERNPQNSLVEEYTDYVHKIVRILIQKMSLPTSAYDDFVSAGYLGLVEASRRFDPLAGVEFKNYAFLRIRGSIIDSIRACSDVTGETYHMARALGGANEARIQELHEMNTGYGAASDVERLQEILEHVARGGIAFRVRMADVESEILEISDPNGDPERALTRQEVHLTLRRLVESLPENQRTVIEEYYFRGKSFVQIAQTHGRGSKSWICRLHLRALENLRKQYLDALGEHED
jgi:RNA polymerase sigma factor FliA